MKAKAKAKARLFIKEMVMRNFKSYAGEKRVGPFHKSFTAVVGPNGSGKSNVIDAMLFVFGKRAKQMRLNKVSELIHNSTNHQNLDSAGVCVHFQEIIDLDDGTYEAVAGSDFVITRVAFRDNSSKYYINDRASNFTEVTRKLKGKGVDLDNNRFLILQGEVEQISLMKPKAQGPHDEGFLEYLEDIIGTNQYVEKIEESYKQKLMEDKAKNKFNRVCVFCGSSSGNRTVFSDAAFDLGHELVKRRINLVYGGGSVGLMGLISQTVYDGGCHVLGVIPTALLPLEISGQTVGELISVSNMHDRKAEMARQADAFIALPGGYGTMEELLETITWAQLGIHNKLVGLLNVDGYYNPLLALFDNSVAEGFIHPTARNIVVSASTAKELMVKMEQYTPSHEQVAPRDSWEINPLGYSTQLDNGDQPTKKISTWTRAI